MKSFLYFIIIILMWSCKSESTKLPDVNKEYTIEQIDSIKYSLIRYLGKLPGKANHGTKFNSDFDDYYKDLAKQHDLVYFIKGKDDFYYFLFTRIAPSLYEKKVAIGGKLKIENGTLVYYEEAFRTWKMLVPELEEKMHLIFNEYMNGKDLSKYYTVNSNGIEYIEFPDEVNTFDVDKRIWVSSVDDYLEPYYELKKGVDTMKNSQ